MRQFADVLKRGEREGNTLSVYVRQGWESGSLRTLVKNNPAKATGAHVGTVGHVTPDELRRYLTATETANGFANRFIWLASRRSKLLPDGGRPDERALAVLRGRLADAARFARTVGEVAGTTRPGTSGTTDTAG